MEAPSAVNERDRYEIEFEFVQNLANVGYLEYLRYWKRPEYLVHLRFPHCLAFLDALIDNQEFRREICKVEVRDFVHQQQAKHWMQGTVIHPAAAEVDVGAAGSINCDSSNVGVQGQSK